jgi:hypothetical protein
MVAASLTGISVTIGLRAAAESIAEPFRNSTQVANHRDADGDGLNDYTVGVAEYKLQDCAAVVGEGKYYANDSTARLFRNKDVLRMSGCSCITGKSEDCLGLNPSGTITGTTYELYDQQWDFDGVLVGKDIDSGDPRNSNNTSNLTEIASGKCREYSTTEYACAYDMDDMVCVDGVFCSFAFGVQIEISGLGIGPIDGRINNGKDRTDSDTQSVADCKDLTGTDLEKLENPGCRWCQAKDENGAVTGKYVCGYTYDPEYLAHCAVKKQKLPDVGPAFPRVISPYCTGKATLKGGDGFDSFAFSGRVMRCVEQTIDNIFWGKYQTISSATGEIESEKCLERQVTFSEDVGCQDGFFVRIQNTFRQTVMIILALFVTLLGVRVIMGSGNLMEIVKLIFITAIVMYFALGNAWKDNYYNFLMRGATEIGILFFQAGETSRTVNDGCQYNFNTRVGPHNIIYAQDEQHYAVWDMFDCKLAQYFGFGVKGEYPQFIKLLTHSLFSVFAILIILVFGIPITLIFLWIMFKALFIATVSVMVISLLIFISPLVIPLVLFSNSKVKGIFDGWKKQLIGYSLQPLILFAFLSFNFAIMDNFFYGSSTFTEGVMDTDCDRSSFVCLISYPGDSLGTTSILGIEIPWISTSYVTELTPIIFKLFFVLLVMASIFEKIKDIMQSLIGISGPSDSIAKGMGSAIKTGGKFALGAAKIGKSGAGKMFNAMRGRNNNDYGTGK